MLYLLHKTNKLYVNIPCYFLMLQILKPSKKKQCIMPKSQFQICFLLQVWSARKAQKLCILDTTKVIFEGTYNSNTRIGLYFLEYWAIQPFYSTNLFIVAVSIR